jgi:hypothetical protein
LAGSNLGGLKEILIIHPHFWLEIVKYTFKATINRNIFFLP